MHVGTTAIVISSIAMGQMGKRFSSVGKGCVLRGARWLDSTPTMMQRLGNSYRALVAVLTQFARVM